MSETKILKFEDKAIPTIGKSETVPSVEHLEKAGDRLRAKYLDKADKAKVSGYRSLFTKLCNTAIAEIEKAIDTGNPPIYVYNPAETDSGILLSKVELSNFEDPAFYMVMKEFANKTSLSIDMKLMPVGKQPLSPIKGANGKQPMSQPTGAIPVIIITL